jgi:hypothetical protein
MNNIFKSKNFIANKLTAEDAFALQRSLLNKVVKIIVDPVYGLFTEEGFPVAIATYRKFKIKKHYEFYAKIIEVEPIVTIYEVPEEA